jgi:hypothetical protein
MIAGSEPAGRRAARADPEGDPGAPGAGNSAGERNARGRLERVAQAQGVRTRDTSVLFQTFAVAGPGPSG